MKETLEEASKNRGLRWHKEGTIGFMHSKGDFVAGAKWQAERTYSDEEVKTMFNRFTEFISHHDIEEWQKWIDKQFKNK